MSIISRIIRKNTMFANFANVMLCSSVLLAGWLQLVLVVRATFGRLSVFGSRRPVPQFLPAGMHKPRHRWTENPLRRVKSFGWMSSGWIVLSVDVLQASALGTEGYSVREINLHRNRSCCYAPSRALLRAWSPSHLRRLQCEVAALH